MQLFPRGQVGVVENLPYCGRCLQAAFVKVVPSPCLCINSLYITFAVVEVIIRCCRFRNQEARASCCITSLSFLTALSIPNSLDSFYEFLTFSIYSFLIDVLFPSSSSPNSSSQPSLTPAATPVAAPAPAAAAAPEPKKVAAAPADQVPAAVSRATLARMTPIFIFFPPLSFLLAQYLSSLACSLWFLFQIRSSSCIQCSPRVFS